MRTEKEIRDKLKEYEENIEFLNNSKLENKKLIQELKQEIAIFKWVLNEIEKI
ncbi:hypothetical protein [Fusobacterium pseudoperiodonticum]|jgi:hypothetical protein|uniref:hypothetical protein n=1 Tax=Fusobacterium pseudoperiodonticum TaxID=2663009 RepID=UPI00204BDEF3|nr:hypothetical protein [Fusobacterium pseudoperiodonticum]DAP13795.1 MAG TPA: hypothetical protein [Caudoviricetes sp.]